jgi:CheY-like chemotaxis protein
MEVSEEALTEEEAEEGPVPRLTSLGDLAAGIAHEINNPLAIMVEEAGWIQDLLEEEEFQQSPNLQEFKRSVKQIQTQGKRCKDITHNLLRFGRKTSSKVEDVQANQLIAEVARAFEKRARDGAVAINTHPADELPIIHVSASELHQVLLNIINNAMDALESSGGTIDISTRTDSGSIIIDIADNGPGISEANLSRIFDPFFTTKSVGKGTGLGLSICYGVVRHMGGNITVDSSPGQGTTFHVRIPAGARAVDDTGLTWELSRRRATRLPEAVASSPTTVLVVDDEVPLAEAMSKRLSKRNFTVRTAFGGPDALQHIEAHPGLDVVLLDVEMPEMNGIETMLEIKKTHPLTEVILLSDHTAVESAVEGIRLGAFDYLVKPCDLEEVFDKIRRAKRKKHTQEQKIVEAQIRSIQQRRI